MDRSPLGGVMLPKDVSCDPQNKHDEEESLKTGPLEHLCLCSSNHPLFLPFPPPSAVAGGGVSLPARGRQSVLHRLYL